MAKSLWAIMKGLVDSEGALMDFPTPGRRIYLDYVNGNDYYDGFTLGAPKKTLDGTTGAYATARDGKGDTIIIVPNGLSTGTVRVDAAFSWAKNNTHMVGLCPPNSKSLRARIAPTATTTAFGVFFTMAGSGCLFKNIQFWHGFNTGTTNSVCMHIYEADYNRFENCHFAGLADAASAANAGSRCVRLTSSDDNEFVGCTFGVDTVARSAANAHIDFVSGSARNVFEDCNFLINASATSPLVVKVATAADADRFQLFKNCTFWNFGASSLKLCTLAANIGGKIVFTNPKLMGTFGGFGTDATSQGQILIDGVASGSTTTGIGYAPNA